MKIQSLSFRNNGKGLLKIERDFNTKLCAVSYTTLLTFIHFNLQIKKSKVINAYDNMVNNLSLNM